MIRFCGIFIVWLLCIIGQSLMPLKAHSFTLDVLCSHTTPLNQGRTSACWAFASASLVETEWLEKEGDTLRISPMYMLYQKYLDQFDAYCDSRGKAEITDGSLGHTFLRIWREDGLMPLEVYEGVGKGKQEYNHDYLMQELRCLARKAVRSHRWKYYRKKVIALLNREIGPVPRTFRFRGQKYTPHSFADSLGIKAGDYVELTSFTHAPFYSDFVLDVPDNWEHCPYYNLPLDELEAMVRRALTLGYTVVWDGDVTEEGYDTEEGVAEWKQTPLTPEERQKQFERHDTTDDHMMHIIGMAHDERGKIYFVMKNSYGITGAHHGWMYMSEEYFRAKTVAVMLNRKCLELIRHRLVGN